MQSYDVIIIGSGTAGQTAAYDLKDAGLNVALVENSERPGGTCALAGCQPKKWFYEVAEVIAKSRHLQTKGITTAAAGDWHAVWEQKQKFTDNIPDGTVNGFYEAGIDFLPGTAAFKDDHILYVDGQAFGADFFIVATGAKPAAIPLEGAEHLVTSSEFLERSSLPGRIVFVGGGFISFEFAHFAARIGPQNRSITILEAKDQPLQLFDQEMVDLLLKASAEDGIDVRSNIQITAIDKQDDIFCVLTDSELSFEADLVVHGAGRVADIEDLNLESIGVSASKKGIQVNAQMQTKVPHIFAAGDCAATAALARVADFEAHVAAKNIIAIRKDAALMAADYRAVPFVLFSYPQYGMVGQTETALKREGTTYRKNTAVGVQWPTYRRVGIQHAGYKILVAEDDTILGAHVVSDNASGLINTLRQAIIEGTTTEKLYWHNIMSPYPSRESDIVYMLKTLIKK
ncbi:MAG: NAD(P)/FAD-dependent oxidoreductase [Desulfobacterales bacterium]|jgi:glutathione reductase (NADPH)